MNEAPLSAVAAATALNPVLVEVTRGTVVESRHRGSIAVVDAAGRVLHQAGDVAQAVYPRSAIKPLQALLLVESGAADRFGLGDKELALACASHRGESVHTEAVAAWLGRVGLSPGDLECGAHLPYDPKTMEALLRADGQATTLHNNCSGKHSGFVTTALHMGLPLKGYIRPEHPLQQKLYQTIEEMGGESLADTGRGADGCGIPVFGVPLRALARAFARLDDTTGLAPERAAAAARILKAMAAEPVMVSGHGNFVTRVMEVAGDTVRLKSGAEGVYCALLVGRGIGITVKIDDGTGRAAEVAMAAALQRLGAFSPAQEAALSAFLEVPIRNVAGRDVGVVRSAGQPF
ncbi:asparaginase [Stella humosa]|uniref:Asparaginase n=1 Tax=Stella humosa TaxID=94 RepID=A0A3N1LBZ3_9PROT|nr:asparaginase [Stella humosa]ROP90511.1 asparaginase [Stella humosa]BBK29596.1 asparaginase [Stella humosa]